MAILLRRSEIFPLFDRKLLILSIAQAIAGSSIPVFFLISGLMGARLAPNLKLSTLPMSLVVVGVACSSPMASWVMAKLGRKRGHLIGISISMLGAAIAIQALSQASFILYCLACATAGSGAAFNNQIRFTAAEGAGEQKALVHSWILSVSLVCAFLGPWIAQSGRAVLSGGEYAGSAAILLTLLLGVFLLMLMFPDASMDAAPQVTKKDGALTDVLRQRKFWTAAICGVSSYATMTLLMSATPLQMREIEHFTISETTRTIQSHIAAMYLPSLFSGILLSRFGVKKLAMAGVALFLLSIALGYGSSHFHHYWWALVILGVAWNFLFLASSTQVSLSFSGPERFVAQGANDSVVFGTQAMASLSAGWLLFALGWKQLVLLPIPLLLILAGLILIPETSRPS